MAYMPGGIVYPRVRIPLDGSWNFKADSQDIGEAQGWYAWGKLVGASVIEVPFCWQSQFPDLLDYHGFVWYQKKVKIAEEYSGGRVALHIGAVIYDPKIWVNGALVGEFKGGYYPLEIDLSRHIRFGADNLLTLKVFHPDPSLIKEYPHGKQTWYCFVGGIWQSTFIEITSTTYLSNLFIIPDIKKSRIRVWLSVNNLPENPEGYYLTLRVVSPEGEEFEEEFSINKSEMRVELILPKLLLWTLENPRLYSVTAVLRKDGSPVDEMSVTTGLREVEVKDGKICLNGEPIYLRGVLNQDFYPKTIYTPPGDDFIRREIEIAKNMGINLIRIHLKLADERYLDWADRLGILIWEEVPNVDSFTPQAEERLTETLRGMILRDRNHPSIIVWGIANEAWGVDPATPTGRGWLVRMYNLAKTLDPTRLVVDNSPNPPNFHIITDIDDYHWYNTIPGSYRQWIDFIRRFSSDPSWTFGNEPIKRGGEPLVVSEFGVWGLPSLENVRKGYAGEGYSGDPWWFDRGWGPGIPRDAEKRFRDWRLDEVWKDWEEFAAASQWHQFEALKFMIEEMRKYPQIVGYIITEFYDLHWECNGLLDFYRNPKVYMTHLPAINNDNLLIIDRAGVKLNLWSGESFSAPIYFSKWSGGELAGAKLRWRLENFAGGEMSGITVEPFAVAYLGEIRFTAPPVTDTVKLALTASLLDSGESLVSSNSINIVVSPPSLKYPRISRDGPILFYSPENTLSKIADELRVLGYSSYTSKTIRGDASIMVSARLDGEVEDYVRSGGRALILIDSLQDLDVDGRKYIVEHRKGEWITGFHYIRDRRVVKNLPVESPLGWSYYLTMPELVIRNISPMESENILAGYFEGWIHEHAATIYMKEVRRGQLILSTFKFSDYAEDPVTTILFNNLLQLLAE